MLEVVIVRCGGPTRDVAEVAASQLEGEAIGGVVGESLVDVVGVKAGGGYLLRLHKAVLLVSLVRTELPAFGLAAAIGGVGAESARVDVGRDRLSEASVRRVTRVGREVDGMLYVVRDDVHHAADSVRAVERRGGAAEDLNALEQALRIKDKFPDTRITILTMGLPKAADILREGLFRGTDAGVLVTDRALAGADTLATSYVLSQTIRKMGKVDLVIGGRQAIDGDTAQVGPQVAQKLGIDQVTYVEEINEITDKHLVVTRRIDGGIEQVKAPLPLMLTVTGSAAPCRPRNAKLVMRYKRALVEAERNTLPEKYAQQWESRPELHLTQWGAADIDADLNQCGLTGSPTKVKSVQNVVFATKESKRLSARDADIEALITELLDSHTIG